MDAKTWAAEKDLLADGAALPASERVQYIREQCHDPAVREALLQLVADSATLTDLLVADPAALSDLFARPPLVPGTRLGAYVIELLLGRGGMREVYHARDPRLDRCVAIKILPSADPELKAQVATKWS